MSFLSDAISQAEQQININTKGQINSLKQGAKGALSNIKNTAASGVSGAVNNVVRGGVNAVSGAVGSLLTGNISGAVSGLINAPSKIFDSALSGLGGFAGPSSATLQSPGNFSAMSSIGGVDPGNGLAGALARSDPMMSFTWYAQLPIITPGTTQTNVSDATNNVLSTLTASPVGGVLSSAMGGAVSTSQAAQLPWYYVEEATMPFRQFESKAIFREGRNRNYPDKYSVDTLRLAIYSDSSNVAFTYLQAWNNAIMTPFSSANADQLAGGWGRPSDYKKPIYIYLLDVTKNVLAIVQYTECWPVSVDTYQMNSGNAERVVNHVTFSVGDVFINLMDVPADLTSSVTSNLTGLNPLSGLLNAGQNVVTQGTKMFTSAGDWLANNVALDVSQLHQPSGFSL